jgi:predicted Mrr-cat superfamily restriction endonuclease
MNQSAYVLRIAPGGIDKVPDALATDQIIIGWSQADGLLDESLAWEQFRQIIRDTYYSDEITLRKAGAAAGHMSRFIREMKVGDLVVVPHGPDFYVAEVVGSAVYLPAHKDDDTAYRRPVKWLNDKKPITRKLARSALLSRLKFQGTCAPASDLIGEIKECLDLAAGNQAPAFQSDLRARLIREVLSEMRGGRIESFGFENLIETVLKSLGAKECCIVPRNQDKGADLIATFHVAGAFQLRVAVQAKHWQPEPPVGRSVVEQLIRGIEAETANLGMVITSGSIADDAYQAARKYFEDEGIRIELVDGEQFAKLIVEHGIGTS